MHARILFISSCDGKGTCADARACARASSMLFYFSSRECVCAVRRVRGMLSCVRSPSFLSFPHCKQLVTQPILWLHPPPPPPPPSSSEPRLAPRGYCNRGAWARRSAAAAEERVCLRFLRRCTARGLGTVWGIAGFRTAAPAQQVCDHALTREHACAYTGGRECIVGSVWNRCVCVCVCARARARAQA